MKSKKEKAQSAKPAAKSSASPKAPASTKAPAKAPPASKQAVAAKPAVTKPVGSKPGATATESKPAAKPQLLVRHSPFDEKELEQFRVLLQQEKEKVTEKARQLVQSGNIQLEKEEMYDEVDLASATVEQNLTFRLLDRDRKLLGEIEHALGKIDSGDYGYCEGTGEVIPKRRLELRPWTRHSVKYKEQLERMKKSGRGVVDEDEEI